MQCEIITAGFGGQGILFTGDLIAQAGLREGKHVTFLPTYGVAMRGGTANCLVKVSDEEIGSPLFNRPNAGIIMNEPSLVKFQSGVAQGGVIIANSTLIDHSIYERGDDVRIFWVPATQTARDVAGTERSANMVALGAFLAVEPIVEVATIEDILRDVSGEHKRALIEKNIAALEAGRDLVAAQAA
ncbi:MAG: 2-oxoacid:ferredoxin oxidoreductase subunit gamma [Nitrospiraceae bacterium]|nr:2-oxoacid:ferredoxin oxidoreductase subunit gamma [Nitrospiraceae bacterium]